MFPQSALQQTERSGSRGVHWSVAGIASDHLAIHWDIHEPSERNEEVPHPAGTRIHFGYEEYKIVE
jgi:hypothetical protein